MTNLTIVSDFSGVGPAKYEKLPTNRGRVVHSTGALKSPFLAVIGDVHFGPRKQRWLDEEIHFRKNLNAVDCLMGSAYASGCRIFVFAGDLFDKVTVSPSYVSAINRTFTRYTDKGSSIHVIAGNHDIDGSSSALKYLPRAINQYHNPDLFMEFGSSGTLTPPWVGVIPFSHGCPALDAVDGFVAILKESTKRQVRTVIMHYGVYGDHEKGWFRQDPSFIDFGTLREKLRSFGVRNVIAGHRHSWSLESDTDDDPFTAINVGSVMPRSSSERGFGFGNIAVIGNDIVGSSVDFFSEVALGLRYLDESDVLYEGDGGCWVFVDDSLESNEDISGLNVEFARLGKVKEERKAIIKSLGSVRSSVVDYIVGDRDRKFTLGIANSALAVLSGSSFSLSVCDPLMDRGIGGEAFK